MDVCVGRRGFSVWPFAYRTRVEWMVMRQVKPKHRLMMTLFDDLRWILLVLYIRRIHPICQTGNTDRSEALGWGFPMAESGGREAMKEEFWRSANLTRSDPRRPGRRGCFDLFRLVGCGNEKIQQRAA